MKRLSRLRFNSDVAVHVIGDALMVSVALLISLIICYLSMIDIQGNVVSVRSILQVPFGLYARRSWLLTLISLIVFYLSGLYTHGQVYRDRHKVLVLARAVTLIYLIFGFLSFLSPASISLPRSILLLAWFLTMAFVIGARAWSMLWHAIAQKEGGPFPTGHTDSEIMDVLVIGGAGCIGSALVERLLELKYRVRVLDCLIYGDHSVSAFYEHPGFELVQGDFRNVDTVVRATQGMDAVVHLGAVVGDSACSVDQDLAIEINLRATPTIAEVGKGFGVRRFIFASTCSVYGASDEILDERSALRPISLYARTKVESEKVLLGLADARFSPTILRFGTVYGLSPRPRFDLVVNLLTAKAVQDGEVGIFGGQQWRPLVHVRDVAEAIVLCLQAPLYNVRGQIFNVGSNEQNYQIAELGRMIKEMVPTARVVTQPKEDDRNYRVCFDKIHNMLNFKPRYTVRDGIQEIIDAFSTGQVKDYREPCCSNFAFLKQNAELRRLFMGDREERDWARLSAEDAAMLTEIAMAAFESRSVEMKDRLYRGLVQALLGDVDGFLNTLAGIDLISGRRVISALQDSSAKV